MFKFLNKKISTLSGIIIIVLISLIAISGTYWWYKSTAINQEEEKEEGESLEKTPDENQPKTSDLSSIDETWYQYTNYKLGFSMKIPKNMTHGYGACVWNEQDNSYKPEQKTVPVKVFEDIDNKIVYITNEYYYELLGETKEASENEGYRYLYSECNQVFNTLERIKNEYRTQERGYYQRAWKIIIKDIVDDNALDNFIKNHYGLGCSLGEKKPTEQDGTYNISIQGDNKSMEETQCPINYVTVLKYSPRKNKAVSWDIGQDCVFYLENEDDDNDISTIYDYEMRDSFKFV